MDMLLSCILSLFLLILLPSSSLASQIRGNVSLGQSLTASPNGPTWLSPLGHFALGFHEVNTSGDRFLLAIWYAKIPDTIVWYATEGNPVGQGSTVKLSADQGLVLNDPQGSLLWNTFDELRGGSVSHGFMNDTGNFALKSSNDVDPVWQSFEHPTDTLLPTQTMEQGTALSARRSETNFTQGRFQLIMQTDGNLVLYPRDPPSTYSYHAYYATGTYDYGNATNAGLRVVYEESGYMYLLRRNGSKFDLTSDTIVSSRDYYHRATLNFDGVLTWNYHPRSFTEKTDVTWLTLLAIPDNICETFGGETISGACGHNSLCSLGDNKRPRCDCPSNFSLVDPSDMYGNCEPDFKLLDCEHHGKGAFHSDYKLMKLQNTDLPDCDYAVLQPSTEEHCQNFCLDDCFCAAVVFQPSSSTCSKKKLPFLNGKQGSEIDKNTWIKVGNGNYSDNQLNPVTIKVRNKLNTVVTALLAGSVFVNFCILSVVASLIFFIYHKKQFKPSNTDQGTLREYSNVTYFSYGELKEATDGFKEEIGRGAFAVVYRGVTTTRGPPFFMAVKKLDRISQDADKEFKTEVNVIGQTHHKNLVRLIGFCKEGDHRLLVYEYMSNGSLADYLYGEVKPSWWERIQIAQGTARGLLYLHEECGTQIIHCDIKPQNVLLDDYNNACISDFGLAKLLVLNQTQTNTAIRGTKGYVAPEWFRNKPVTVKVDVYSFGVLLLEIICCRKSIRMEVTREEEAILTDWALDCYQFGTLDSLVNDDTEALSDRARLERFVMVALWCIQEDPSIRPTMRMVSNFLICLRDLLKCRTHLVQPHFQFLHNSTWAAEYREHRYQHQTNKSGQVPTYAEFSDSSG